MSKHYNLTVTDDNGKSVTTSNTSTEHAEEILRMMQLAGMQSQDCGCGASPCGCDESIEENEYKPTPANDKLDLDDYSKKSGESIPKQKKSLDKAPSRGDNPLEYSLDENEIFESLMNEFETVEEGKLPPGLQAYQDKKKGKKDVKDDKEDKVEEKKAKPDFADIDGDGDKKETMKKAAKDKKEKADESINEAKCDCDCGKDPCEECGKSHHKVKEESQELARLRKLAGTEKVDELAPLAALAPIAGAVGRALVSKGIKGTASRAAATTVANKALSKKSNTTHNPHQ